MSGSSGKFLLRIDPALHRALARRAKKAGVSLNALCADFLRGSLQAPDRTPWWSELGEAVVALLARRFGKGLVGVLVFGSYLQGTATEDSDLDLLIVLDAGVPLRRGLYRWWDEAIADLSASVELSPQFVHLPDAAKEAGGIWLEAAMAHEILWERGRRLSTMLDRLKSSIARDGVRRYWSNGQPYWVRRGDEEPESRE